MYPEVVAAIDLEAAVLLLVGLSTFMFFFVFVLYALWPLKRVVFGDVY